MSMRTNCGLQVVLVMALAAASVAAQEQGITLSVRHDHLIGGCRGTLVFDERGVRYETADKDDARSWSYEDIKEFQVTADRHLNLLTYEDRSNWRLGADKTFEFTWSDDSVPAAQIYAYLAAHTRRPISAALVPGDLGTVQFEFAVKHLGVLKGSEGRLQFTEGGVAFHARDGSASRFWRFDDLESISSGGPYDLALTTYEHQRMHYGSRRIYNFQLKEALPRERYNALWQLVNEKKGFR